MPSRARTAAFALITIMVGCAIPLVGAEIALTFLPVSTYPETTPVDEAHPVVHFRPNRSYVTSIGARLERPTRHRTNNAGWVSEQEYDSTATTPLLAVIGDSYVEALVVPSSSALQTRLATDAGPGRRVYSFAMSGWPLSQYLGVADYLRTTYRPSAIVVVVVGNDFDESLAQYRVSRWGLYLFAERASDSLELTRTDDLPKPWYWFVRRSSLVRYLRYQLHLDTSPRAVLASVADGVRGSARDTQYVGNVLRAAAPERIALSERVVDQFLRELPQRAQLPGDRIVLVLDGIRPELYDSTALARNADSYVARMRDYLVSQARARGFEVVDMQPIFRAHYETHGQRFESRNEAHWNALGHAVVAEAIARTNTFQTFRNLPSPGSTTSLPRRAAPPFRPQ